MSAKKRLGRAYSVHGAMGRFGFAAGPLIAGGTAAIYGWRYGLGAAGLIGLVMAMLFWRFAEKLMPDYRLPEHYAAKPIRYRDIARMPAVLLAFGYFLFTTAASGGFQNFSSVSFVKYYGVTLPQAASMLSAFLIASATGMLLGGVIADHSTRHVRIAVTGLVFSCCFMGLIASNLLPLSLVAAAVAAVGLSEGLTAPSRRYPD